MIKTYIGRHTGSPGGQFVRVQPLDGGAYPLEPRHNLRNHSPDGFNWGYGGSGPAQLALALCVDALSHDRNRDKKAEIRALEIYQAFKSRVVAKWNQNEGWEISQEMVVEIIRELENEPPGATADAD